MKKYIVLFAGIIAMTGLVHAQAPASVAGTTAGVKITGGDGSVFATSGFYVLVTSNDGNSFQTFADNETMEAGTISSYIASGATATAAFMLTSPITIPGSVTYVFTNSLSGTNSVTTPDVGGYQNGDFTMFTNPVPASIAGQDFYVSIQEGGGSFATNGDFVLSLASLGNAYTITATRAGGANSHGTYSYSQLNNSCGQIQLADSDGTGSTAYFGFTNATSGGFYLASTNGYQIGNATLLTAQAPSSIAGDTLLSIVTSGTPPLLATNGYELLVPTDSGTNYQIIGIAHVADTSGTYSYSSSGATATLSFDDNLQGSLNITVFAFSPTQGKWILSAGPSGEYVETGDLIAFTNPAPDSIAGQDFYVNIQDGGGSFATNGDFVISFAGSGNTYAITSVSGGGVVNSQGTYSYSKLNSTCGGITLTDSVAGVSMVYLALSNSTSGVFTLTQSPTSFQVGQLTHLTAQPVSSIVGDTVLAAVNSGTGPFATNGYFLFVPADSGNNYQLIGLAHVADSDGTYSYSTSGPSGIMSLDDSVNGPLDLNVFFTAPFKGNYAVNVGPYTQTGDVTGFTNPVPDSIAGEAFNITVTDGAAPFASSGVYTLTTAASGNTYSIIPVGNGTSSHGTYSYSKLNSTCGGITLMDSVTGVSAAYLTLSNSDSGTFALTQSSTSFQIGSVAVLPILNLTQNGNEIMVSWTTNATGFSLQSSTSLSPTAIWSAAPAPIIVGGNYVSTDAISDNAKFYRLKK